MAHLTEALLTFANRGALELLVWSWQALILLVCVWAGLKLLRVQTPALRQHIWLIALLAIFSLPVWSRLSPKLPLSERRWNNPALNYAAELPRFVITPTAETALPVTQQTTTTVAPKSRTVARTLVGTLCLWFVGALCVLIRNARGYARLRRARRQARLATPADLGCALRLPNPIRLGLSTDVRSPVLVGLWQPLILLPHDLAEWATVEEREAMIAHELAHLARRDHFTNLFPLALNVIFFFHPLVRYACRQFCLEREMACDDRVIHHGADAATYAESLVKTAEHSLKGKLSGLASYSLHQPAFFTSKQALERRIEMILTTNRVRVLARQWRYLVLPAVLIASLAWLLVPARTTKSGMAQEQTTDRAIITSVLKEMARSKAYDWVIHMASADLDPERRKLAAQTLVETEGDGSTSALLALYRRSHDSVVKEVIIRGLAERNEVDALAFIWHWEDAPEHRQAVLQQLELIAQNNESADARNAAREAIANIKAAPANAKQLPPPPPPPPPVNLNNAAEVEQMLKENPSDASLVLALLRATADAQIRHDTAFLERALADDYEAVGPDGEVLNKAESIAEARRLDQHIKKFEIDNYRLRDNGSSAVASFLGTVYYEENGKETTIQFRYTVNFLKRQGGWQIVGSHQSRVR